MMLSSCVVLKVLPKVSFINKRKNLLLQCFQNWESPILALGGVMSKSRCNTFSYNTITIGNSDTRTSFLHSQPTISAPRTFKSSAESIILTHTDDAGAAKMIDVSNKKNSSRVAVASARVILGSPAFKLVFENKLKKGDVLTVAKLAGINAAKQTHLLIPLCHSIILSEVKIDLTLNEEHHAIDIRSTAKTSGQTGVEMEAMMGASVSSLAIYDMCKGVSKEITIEHIRLEEKSGGVSGVFSRTK
jgi:cyclic pyranopterin monophosphate synthase